ncbi:MAG: arylsulfatase [Verrucomicrobia bacterium]|nr:arylsulfatase [Verrucomicrobiota bacterium]
MNPSSHRVHSPRLRIPASPRLALRWVAVALWGLLPGVPGHWARAATPAPKPNIIVILADDMGYSDVGCYGGEIETPHLDGLAAGGVRFTQFYNTARCCPTRASLLTGLHPHQAGVGHMMENRGFDGYRGDLNRRCVTIAEALQSAGYRNYAVGKWHVTPGRSDADLASRHNWPLQRGFHRYYGTIHGAGSFWDPSALTRDNQPVTVANDPEYRPREFYYTDAISDHAVRFIREHGRDHAASPFFLYMAFTAAHWPMHAKPADIAKYRGRYDAGYAATREARWTRQKALGLVNPDWALSPIAGDWGQVTNRQFESRCMEVYAAMVDCMDQGIGRVVAELKHQQQLDNTLILYLQDNGGCAETIGRGPNAAARGPRPSLPPMDPGQFQYNSVPRQTRDGWPVRQGYGVLPGPPDTYIAYGREWANVSNTPFREYKHWVHEGGISTPLIVHWPARMGRGREGGTRRDGDAQTRGGGRLVHEPGQLVDIMATLVDVSGATYPRNFKGHSIRPMEGRTLAPLFSPSPPPGVSGSARLLYWEHEGNRAIRDGSWKLVAKENQPWELYDLAADRTELRNLASAHPDRVRTMAAAWDAWAARADVLPLGAWRGKTATGRGALSTARRFVLKAGVHLDRSRAPAIAKRAFTVTATFDTGPARDGVIVAHGGSALGYALYLAGGQLQFTVRTRAGTATAVSGRAVSGTHTAVARLDGQGALSLALDGGPPATARGAGPISAMPVDGLDVGADSAGAVGPYTAPHAFGGTIQSVVVELD